MFSLFCGFTSACHLLGLLKHVLDKAVFVTDVR